MRQNYCRCPLSFSKHGKEEKKVAFTAGSTANGGCSPLKAHHIMSAILVSLAT